MKKNNENKDNTTFQKILYQFFENNAILTKIILVAFTIFFTILMLCASLVLIRFTFLVCTHNFNVSAIIELIALSTKI